MRYHSIMLIALSAETQEILGGLFGIVFVGLIIIGGLTQFK